MKLDLYIKNMLIFYIPKFDVVIFFFDAYISLRLIAFFFMYRFFGQPRARVLFNNAPTSTLLAASLVFAIARHVPGYITIALFSKIL